MITDLALAGRPFAARSSLGMVMPASSESPPTRISSRRVTPSHIFLECPRTESMRVYPGGFEVCRERAFMISYCSQKSNFAAILNRSLMARLNCLRQPLGEPLQSTEPSFSQDSPGAAMKRLLVCLLLVGVVGCGKKEPAKETPSNEAASPNKLVDQPSGNPDPGSATEKPRSAEEMADALKTIALAFRNRADVHRGFYGHNPRWFDKDGRPYLSWRVFLLPFAGERSLFREFRLEEPWDSQHNKALLDRMPAIYKTPGLNRSGYTSLLTFTGRNTPFDYTRRRTGGMWQLLSPFSGPIPDLSLIHISEPTRPY